MAKVRIDTQADVKQLQRYQQELDEARKKLMAADKSVEEFTKEMAKLDRQQRQLNKLTGEGTTQTGKLDKMFGGLVITAGDVVNAARAIGDQVFSMVQAFADDERAIIKLKTSVEAAGVSWETYGDGLQDVIQDMMMVGAYGDTELTDAMAGLIQVTGNAKTSTDLLALSMDLARGKSIDLKTASELVGKVYAGNMGTLSRYGIVLEKGATSTEALAELQRRFAGQAEEYGNSVAGSITKIQLGLDELKEGAGEGILRGFDADLSDSGEQIITYKDKVRDITTVLAWSFKNLTGAGHSLQIADKLKEIWGEKDGVDDLTTSLDGTTSAFERMTEANNRAATSMSELIAVQEELTGAQYSAEESAIALERAENRLEDATSRVADLEAAGEQGTREYEDALLDVRQATVDLQQARDRAAENDEALKALELERDRLNEVADAAYRAAQNVGQIPTTVSKSGTGRVLMAEGGILPATPGGLPVLAAEAGVDEAFIPIERTPRSQALAERVAAMVGSSSTSNSTVIDLRGSVFGGVTRTEVETWMSSVLDAYVRNAAALGRQ